MGDPRCRHCGRPLTNRCSILLGYGPDCAALLGITLADVLPQRCACCTYSKGALELLYGVGPSKAVERWDGSTAWVDVATGELVVVA